MFNKKIKNMISFITLLTIVGCADNHSIDPNTTQSVNGNTLPYSFSNFSDIPIPEQSEMNMNQTAIYGRGNEWLGRLIFSTPYSVGGVYDFYVEEMKKFGWTEITSVRGVNSVLTFMMNNRVALIQLQPSGFRGSDVLFTVSPAPNKTKKENKKINASTKKVVKTSITQEQVDNTKPYNMEQMNSGTIESKRIDTMPLSQSNLFVSPDARKSMSGSLGLGTASNQYYKSTSKGVGKPVEI